jgi:D-amino peptidase
MRIYISSDIEGVAGVVDGEQGRPGNAEHERARRLMTQEVNAAIAGAIDGGATEVLVNDSHGPMRNLLIEDIDSRARLISGKPKPVSMMEGLSAEHAGVFALGYHARAGSHGILAHTINGFAFARITVNGSDFGESGLYGAYAGELGVPVVLFSGDDCLKAEVGPLFPGAEIVEVKRVIMNTAAESMTPKAAREAIRAAAARAVGRAKEIKPFRVLPPITVRVQLNSIPLADLISLLPGTERTAPAAVTFVAGSMRTVIRTLNSMSAMSFMLR